MKPQAGHDPFDLEFDADDEFAPPQSDAWREAVAAAEPPVSSSDPFADLPPTSRRRRPARRCRTRSTR